MNTEVSRNTIGVNPTGYNIKKKKEKEKNFLNEAPKIDLKEVQILSKIDASLASIVNCEAGLYIPIGTGEMYITFGINGILSDVNVEIGISINILKNTYEINLGFVLFLVNFDFYLKVGIYIHLNIISFRFDYYIFYIIIPLLMPITTSFHKLYSFRNKLLENSNSARLSLFFIPVKADFISNFIDKQLLSKFLP